MYLVHWVFVAVHGLSLVAGSGRLLFVVVRGLLIAVASLVAEHRLHAHGLSSCGSWALECWFRSWATLSCSMARGIFPDQESNPWPLH